MQSMRDIIDFLNRHTELYDKGTPEISDKDWDKVYFQLAELEKKTGIFYPDSPTQKISYEVVNELKKVEHNHSMLSLAKTKDWYGFLNYFNGINPHKDVVGMPKMDGLTCSLRYVNGRLVSAETRGNGEVGEDVLHNAKTIPSIPLRIDYEDELIVDGEIICRYDDFHQFSDKYANPRNFASGSIRLLDSKECSTRYLTFVLWNVVKGFDETNSFMEKLNKAEKVGFTVVPWTSSFDWDAKEFLVDAAEELGYPIDGLVGRFNDVKFGESLGSTGHHSRAAYAFKFYDEVVESTLLDIEWHVGKTGVLTPVAVFEPIDLEGTVVERASVHNLTVMEELLGHPYKGQKVNIYKANQIIPQIESADLYDDGKQKLYFDIPHICPHCGEVTFTEKNNDSEQLYCSNKGCKGRLINRLEAFCGKKGLDIKGLSVATLEKLIDWGWIGDFESIFTLKDFRTQWMQKEGFGEKSVDNILTEISNSSKCTLDKFLTALSIPLISSSNAKEICKHVKDYQELMDLIENNFDFTEWETFGPEKSASLKTFDFKEANFLVYNLYVFIDNPIFKDEGSTQLNNLTFVVTGKINHFKNRNELKAVIEENGGKVVGSVSNKTSYLINNDIDSTSSKNKTAKDLNIPIITEDDFLKLLKG